MKNLRCQNLGVDVSKDALEVVFSTLDMDRRVKVKASQQVLQHPHRLQAAAALAGEQATWSCVC